MINPYHFIDKNLKQSFKISPDSHKNNDANSLLTIIPIYPELGIETR